MLCDKANILTVSRIMKRKSPDISYIDSKNFNDKNPDEMNISKDLQESEKLTKKLKKIRSEEEEKKTRLLRMLENVKKENEFLTKILSKINKH